MMKRSVRLLERVRFPERRLAPGRLRPREANPRTALATAMGVAGGILGSAANRRAPAEPALAPRFAQFDIAVVRVADLADGRHAFDGNETHLPTREAQGRPLAFARQQLRPGAGRSGQLPAAAGLQLDIMHLRPQRDTAQRQGIAGPQQGHRAIADRIAHLDALRRQDISASPHLHIPAGRCARSDSGRIRR